MSSKDPLTPNPSPLSTGARGTKEEPRSPEYRGEGSKADTLSRAMLSPGRVNIHELTPMIHRHFLARLLLLSIVLVLCDSFASEAQAGIGSFFSSMATRARVVQFCVVTMLVALFIIMKKFSLHDSDPRAFAPKMNYAPLVDDKVTS